ncbi:MAG: exo-alpha-sialidase, partial [Planctomycetaceae bacterium]
MRNPLSTPLRKLVLGFVLFIGSLAPLWPRDAIEVRTVVGPGIPGKYKHAPSACELGDGRILLVYYSGSGEYGRDTAIYATELDRASERWSRPRIIADEPLIAEGNPSLWRAPDGRLWLFYPLRHGETWATARLTVKVSADEGRSWTAAPAPTDQPGYMIRARPLTLGDGSCLLPADFNPSTDPEFVSEESGSLFFRSDPQLTTWTATDLIHSRLGNHQPAVAALDDERLVAYCRRGGDYFGRADGMLVRSESRDGGAAWSPGVETEFPNPNAPVDFVRLASGNLLLAFNDSAFERTPLSVAISTDGDRTYPYRRVIIHGVYSYSYP